MTIVVIGALRVKIMQFETGFFRRGFKCLKLWSILLGLTIQLSSNRLNFSCGNKCSIYENIHQLLSSVLYDTILVGDGQVEINLDMACFI